VKRPELKFDAPDVKVPAVIENLYRDLRDRKLLPIVGLLLVAIVAVPIALSASGSTPASTAAPTAEIVPADAPEAQAAVLAENPGLRDYRKRLDALKKANPFDQQFETSGLAGTEVSSGTESTTSTTESGAAPVTGGDLGTSTSTGSTSPSTSTTEPSTSTGSSGGSVDAEPAGESEISFYTFKLDLHFGVEGDVKEHRNVKLLDVLSPVGTFLGATLEADRAVFALSSNIVAVTGDGDCAPSPDSCDFLSLDEGGSVTMTYQREGTEPANYRLVLDDIRVVKVKNPPEFE
jgi:hypothetical protein